ncbi:SusC/RagA family TonB-linked outer membrane protein [Pontibacter beigongshangensis]|uniref:SusC/RagA family TonB-linked outer membrane protein n=1 Tax=Pontibacter beigongshangensis TaxID=2574733 RepID=UPI00164FEB7F|nr:TonB-dependent receptor [Pontibacter beigongshangensis]
MHKYIQLKSFSRTILTGIVLLLLALPAWAQVKVTGKVTSSEGEALVGVTVIVQGTSTGASTDIDGMYALTVPSPSSVLVFSYVSFQTKTVTVGNQATINVTLAADSRTLSEVVVVGYGTQDARDVTGSIVSVSAEKINERQPVDIYDALQGQAAGVQINSDSRPGAESSIRIRGTSTLEGGVNPLFVVDGVPMDNIDGINPNDVQSIEILKDAASAAIYGSRSANGVIIVTTKRGVQGKPKIDVRYNHMMSQLAHKLPVANASDRRVFERKMRGDAVNSPLNADSLNPAFNADNDLQDMITRMARRHQLDFTVSGASDKLNYYTSLGYLDDEGIILNSWAKQVRARVNITYKATDRFEFGNRMQFSYQTENRINEGFVLRQATQRPPTFRVYLPDGTLAPIIAGRRNPLAEALLRKNEYQTYSANVYNYLTYQIADGLKLTSDFNIRVNYGDRLHFTPKLVNNNVNSGGYSNSLGTYWMQQNYLNYDKTFWNDHAFSAVLGVSTEQWVDKSSQIEGSNYVTESIITSNAIGNKSLSDIYNDESRHSLAGIFGRLGYNYKGRYMVNLVVRRDGSSRFGKNNRWGTFPSASVGWRFSDESFMAWTSRVLDDGKLRLSYGETGNERIGNYDALERYTFGGNYYNGVLGIVPSRMMSNDNLSWETTKQLNVGLDLTFLKNRVTFTADYYDKITEDLLYGAPLPGEIGYTSTRVNVGSIQNKGLEFTLNTYPIRNSNLTWNLSYNMAFNQSTVRQLFNGVPMITSGRWYLEEGGAVGDFYGYDHLGVYAYNESNAYTPEGVRLTPVFNEGGNFAHYMLHEQQYTGEVKQMQMPNGISKGGDVIWHDANGDFVIDDKDRVILGNAQPKFIAGIYNQVNYRNFSLAFSFYTQWGNKIYNKGRYEQAGLRTTNITPDKNFIHAAWEHPGDVTNVPRAVIANNTTMNNMPELSSFFLEDGSFVRLRNVKLTYTFDESLTSRIKLKGLSIYAYGNNLLTWTNYSWYDPEISLGSPLSMGEDNGRYPRARQAGLGLNLNF